MILPLMLGLPRLSINLLIDSGKKENVARDKLNRNHLTL